jgi:hypothetical protein
MSTNNHITDPSGELKPKQPAPLALIKGKKSDESGESA